VNSYDKDRKVEVKFILLTSNIADIPNMIKMCVKAGVKNVICDMDLNIKPENYFIYKEPVALFKELALVNGLSLCRGNFVPDELWDSEVRK